MGRIVVPLRALVYVGLIVPLAFIVGVINRECKFESTAPAYPAISLVTYVDPGYVKKMGHLHEWFLNVHVLHMYLGAIFARHTGPSEQFPSPKLDPGLQPALF